MTEIGLCHTLPVMSILYFRAVSFPWPGLGLALRSINGIIDVAAKVEKRPTRRITNGDDLECGGLLSRLAAPQLSVEAVTVVGREANQKRDSEADLDGLGRDSNHFSVSASVSSRCSLIVFRGREANQRRDSEADLDGLGRDSNHFSVSASVSSRCSLIVFRGREAKQKRDSKADLDNLGRDSNSLISVLASVSSRCSPNVCSCCHYGR
ncbi:hypothetical protein J6590_039291 [Homalodisca vitripennis]|nr:hypothetical protein J6590_039291 [Homalodisca vitripennis]